LSFVHRALLWASALSVIAFPLFRKSRELVQIALLALLSGFGLYAAAGDEHPFFWLCLLIPLVSLLPLPGRPELPACLRYALGVLGLTALTHVLFFGEDRYHLAVTPLLCLLAAGALRPQRAASSSAQS
jgi:hypothetical protein